VHRGEAGRVGELLLGQGQVVMLVLAETPVRFSIRMARKSPPKRSMRLPCGQFAAAWLKT
jgi:hypothetical protein